ncbi:MAG: ATP-binding protein [Candidatus Scalindua sp.]|nr:ATP-binding protein [Hyphomicrobiales bacterium]MCP4255307.1 ATP-binding protein [Candidatus Scalindua sp.]
MEQNLHQQIDYYSRQLKLPSFRQSYLELAKQAAKDKLCHEQYLLKLMLLEYDERIVRRKKQRVRRAGFPAQKLLQDLLRDELPQDGLDKLLRLERLDFIREGQNLILAGNPGTGKTHIAIGLGIKACLHDFTVLFTTVPRLITQIIESRSAKSLRLLENRFEKYDLVICDEFGYISFDKQAAELLFTHLSLRAGRKSTIITTNLGFDRWKEIFGDEILTAAMVDRLTHKAIIVNMNGQSYRVKESKMLASL